MDKVRALGKGKADRRLERGEKGKGEPWVTGEEGGSSGRVKKKGESLGWERTGRDGTRQERDEDGRVIGSSRTAM